MKKAHLIGLVLLTLLAFTPPSAISSAAPFAQDAVEEVQIVLVLDVSGSMSTPVYSGIIPEDLLTLLLRLDELKGNSEYIGLQDQLEDAENEPAVTQARENSSQAYQDLADWIGASQESSLGAIQGEIRSLLEEWDCQTTSDLLISTAASLDRVMFYLQADCPATTNRWSVLAELEECVPYLSDPAYQALREEWQDTARKYSQALDQAGYTSLSDQMEAYRRTTGMEQLEDEIAGLVTAYGIPSRLDLAKTAAFSLIDISRLDREAIGRDSWIGLVTFSNQATLQGGLTLNHQTLKPLIHSLRPLQQTNLGDALSLGLSELESKADPDQPMMIILLSDGHANIGQSSTEILSLASQRANRSGITLCTAGFADLETEVDYILLEGLAFRTEGEYLFTNSGTELGSFFAACRDAAAGKELTGRISGIIAAGASQQVGKAEIQSNTCELSLTMNHLSGFPEIMLIDPAGNPADPESEGVSYHTRNQVQLLTVASPGEGEWSIELSNPDPENKDAAYSLVISTTPCLEGENPAKEIPAVESDLPYLLTNQGLSVLTGALVFFVLILGAVVIVVIRFRQRRAI